MLLTSCVFVGVTLFSWPGLIPVSLAQSYTDFTLAGTGETFPLNGVIDINEIGDGYPGVGAFGNGALLCHTDDTTCCRGLDNPNGGGRGEWYLPGETTPIPAPGFVPWYRSRDTSVLRLNRRIVNTNPATTPTGVYRCNIPATSGTVDKFIGVYDAYTVSLCPNLNVANGVVTYDRADIPGKIATYMCSTGYTVSGSATRTCAPGGWQGSVPTCVLIILPTRLAIGVTDYHHNSEILITAVGAGGSMSQPLACFTPEPSTFNWYLPDGSVVPLGSGNAAANELISIRQPTAITLHRGDNVLSPGGLYCCGSSTVPINQRLCITLLVMCPSLTLPPNGMTITYNPPGSPTSQGTVATYQCITGYTPNPSTRTCQNDGTWSGGETTCQSVDCGQPPNIANGSPGTPDMTTFGGTVTYTCDSGYEASPGVTTMTSSCQASGMWDTVTCTVVDCGIPPSIANGFSGTPDKTTFGGTVTYTCEDGLTLSGQAMITCIANGMWSTPPSCTVNSLTPTTSTAPPIFTCPDLTVPSNGMITYSSGVTNVRPVGSTATYSCINGYTINGDTTRTCQSDGKWSGVEPTCDPPPAFLSLGSTNYVFNGPNVPLSYVGEGANSLSCRTDDANCCREEDAGVVKGAWHYPDGSVVSSVSGDLYTTREGPMVVDLNRRDSVDGPTGLYCCVVPTSTGTRPVCAYLGLPLSQPGSTGAIVGGVVALILGLGLALILAITAIVIAYLVLRQRKPQGAISKRDQPDIPLTDKGQSAPPQTYDTVDSTCTYEEIDGTRPLKGISDYTQNQAYAATTAPLRGEGVVSTGGSGNLTRDSQLGGDEEKIYEN